MARYSLSKYGTAKYGLESTSTLVWLLEIDWDDNGAFDNGLNEANRLIGCSVNRGRQYFIASSNDRFEPVAPGQLNITLTNDDDRYNPYNTSSLLYPNVAPGRLIRLRVEYGTTIYNVFAGVIQDIQPNYDDKTVSITAEDGLRWLQDVNVSIGVNTGIFADNAIGQILAAAQWPAIWGSDLQHGADYLDFWWSQDRSAYEEIQALVDSELGRVFVAADGSLKFKHRQDDPASVGTYDQAQLEKGIRLAQPWEVQRNIVKIQANNYGAAVLGPIWTYSGALEIMPSQTVVLNVEFGTSLNIVTPLVAYTDYAAYRWPDATGADLTAYVTVVVSNLTSTSATLTVTNTWPLVRCNVTLLQIRGQEIGSSLISNIAYGTGYTKHPRQLSAVLEWQQVDENVTTFPAQLLTLLNAAPGLPTVTIDTRPDIQFTPDLADKVLVTSALLNLNNYYRVGAISHEWLNDNGQSVRTTYKLEPSWDYSYWKFDTNCQLGTAQLGW